MTDGPPLHEVANCHNLFVDRGHVTDPLFMLLDPMRYRSESMVMATAATAAAITSPTRMKSRAR